MIAHLTHPAVVTGLGMTVGGGLLHAALLSITTTATTELPPAAPKRLLAPSAPHRLFSDGTTLTRRGHADRAAATPPTKRLRSHGHCARRKCVVSDQPPASDTRAAHAPGDPITPGFASEHMLTSRDVAAIFSVQSKTVRRWADAGLLTPIRTPGGHRRYREEEVAALLNASGTRRLPRLR